MVCETTHSSNVSILCIPRELSERLDCTFPHLRYLPILFDDRSITEPKLNSQEETTFHKRCSMNLNTRFYWFI